MNEQTQFTVGPVTDTFIAQGDTDGFDVVARNIPALASDATVLHATSVATSDASASVGVTSHHVHAISSVNVLARDISELNLHSLRRLHIASTYVRSEGAETYVTRYAGDTSVTAFAEQISSADYDDVITVLSTPQAVENAMYAALPKGLRLQAGVHHLTEVEAYELVFNSLRKDVPRASSLSLAIVSTIVLKVLKPFGVAESKIHIGAVHTRKSRWDAVTMEDVGDAVCRTRFARQSVLLEKSISEFVSKFQKKGYLHIAGHLTALSNILTAYVAALQIAKNTMLLQRDVLLAIKYVISGKFLPADSDYIQVVRSPIITRLSSNRVLAEAAISLPWQDFSNSSLLIETRLADYAALLSDMEGLVERPVGEVLAAYEAKQNDNVLRINRVRGQTMTPAAFMLQRDVFYSNYSRIIGLTAQTDIVTRSGVLTTDVSALKRATANLNDQIAFGIESFLNDASNVVLRDKVLVLAGEGVDVNHCAKLAAYAMGAACVALTDTDDLNIVYDLSNSPMWDFLVRDELLSARGFSTDPKSVLLLPESVRSFTASRTLDRDESLPKELFGGDTLISKRRTGITTVRFNRRIEFVGSTRGKAVSATAEILPYVYDNGANVDVRTVATLRQRETVHAFVEALCAANNMSFSYSGNQALADRYNEQISFMIGRAVAEFAVQSSACEQIIRDLVRNVVTNAEAGTFRRYGSYRATLEDRDLIIKMVLTSVLAVVSTVGAIYPDEAAAVELQTVLFELLESPRGYFALQTGIDPLITKLLSANGTR